LASNPRQSQLFQPIGGVGVNETLVFVSFFAIAPNVRDNAAKIVINLIFINDYFISIAMLSLFNSTLLCR
jgi:hypothetical protein